MTLSYKICNKPFPIEPLPFPFPIRPPLDDWWDFLHFLCQMTESPVCLTIKIPCTDVEEVPRNTYQWTCCALPIILPTPFIPRDLSPLVINLSQATYTIKGSHVHWLKCQILSCLINEGNANSGERHMNYGNTVCLQKLINSCTMQTGIE